MNNVEYFFKRNDADNSVVLFIESPNEWFGKRTELSVSNEELVIDIFDDLESKEYRTGKLEPILLSALTNKSNKIIFCNDVSDNIFENIFPPLSIQSE
jgi:hypothetical protein